MAKGKIAALGRVSGVAVAPTLTASRSCRSSDIGEQSERLPEKLIRPAARSRAGFDAAGGGVLASAPQPGGALLLIAPDPPAHRRRGGGKEAAGRFEAALASRLHQPQAMVVAISRTKSKYGVGATIAAGFYPPRAARLPPSRAASSFRLFPLMHNNFARG